MDLQTKRCKTCKEDLSESFFTPGNWNHFVHWSPRCKSCVHKYNRSSYVNRQDSRKESMKIYRAAVKAQVFAAYGKVCKCCGETGELFLDIDHMDNDGAEHRKDRKLSCGTQFYAWLIKNNFPSNFQTLCCNCNRGKYRNGGICPHQAISPLSINNQ